MEPLPLFLPLLVVLLASGGCRACSEIPGYRGTLGTAALVSWTLQPPGDGGSCRCCGLCHQRADCSSLSYRADTGSCSLFGTIASYDTFQRSYTAGPDAPRYFLMPGRSERGQFCRERSDCTDAALDCIGHICTDDQTVTCRDVLTLSGAAALDGFHWGAVHGRTLPLSCLGEGFTLLLRAALDQGGWTEDNWLNRSEPAADPGYTFQHRAYSIMGEAERIRDSAAAPAQFQLLLRGDYGNNINMQGMLMTLDRSTPLLATAPPDPTLVRSVTKHQDREPVIRGQHVVGCGFACWKTVDVHGELTVPYHHGPQYLLTANVNPRTDMSAGYGQQHHDYGTLIKDNGDMRWLFFDYVVNHRPQYVQYYIKE